ncbi:MAG: sulfatase-like hydrolase/transferase [Planctomycetaceae bacterium]|nr:sulfatase-like hydrolase/transferase [Planctomycetaceae bacterium]
MKPFMLLLCISSIVSFADAADRPNIVLIMADDLGYECLGVNGGTSYDAPVFDRIAHDAMRFSNCYSQPICTPSRNMVMTGRSNARNYRGFGLLDSDEITFGSLMRDAGYRTAIAGKWQLTGGEGADDTNRSGTIPEKCGFEQTCMWAYERDVSVEQANEYFSRFPAGMKRKTSRFWQPAVVQNGKMLITTIDDYGPDIFSRFLLDFIEQNKDAPFFVYYPMVLTHNPFVPTPDTPGLTNDVKMRGNPKYFGDMIRYTGKTVERFLHRIEELGLSENTLVIFTADNGTFRELESRMGNRVVIGGKGLPLDAGVHVPMLVWWKGRIQGGSVCHDLIEFSDFMPTFVEAGRARLPTDRRIDGHSFLARLKGEPYTPRDSIFLHYDKDPEKPEPEYRRVRSAFDGRYKLYHDRKMFDVQNDIEEEHPLDADDAPPALRAVVQRLQSVLDSMPPWQPDNSSFNGQPDEQSQSRARRLAEVRATE